MRVDLTLPKGWHEVKGDKLVKLAKLYMSHRAKPDFLSRCFFLFSGWKPLRKREIVVDGKNQYWFKKGKQKFYIDADLFTTLVKKLEWVSTGISLPASMPPVRGFRHCNVKLYSVTLEDYLSADNYFNAFTQTGESRYLGKLFAVFYSRRHWFSRASKIQKYAVFLWFTGVKNYLVNKYPYIFSGNSGNTGIPSPDETILSLLSSLNNGNVTANKDIFKTHVHECFYELNLKIEHAPKIK